MLILLVDIETTQEKPVEIALIAYDTDCQVAVGSFSTLLYADLDDSDPIPTVHRIPNAAVKQWGVELQLKPESADQKPIYLPEILKLSGQWVEEDFDYIVAHNAEFEQKYIDTKIPWLCTYKDFDLFPPRYDASRNLISLAQWYGVGVSVTHRAMYDCLLMVEILSRVSGLRGEIQYALLPKVEWLAPKTAEHPPVGFRWDYTIQGWVGKQTAQIVGSVFAEVGERVEVVVLNGYQNREAAKEWGFQWDGDRKVWHRLANPHHLSAFPFEVEIAN